MYKKHIKYTDYNGVEKEDDYYFNLNKAELVKLNLYDNAGLEDAIKGIIAAKNNRELVRRFEEIIDMSYGIKGPDGTFVKNKEILESFKSSEACSELFVELVSDERAAIAFVNGIMPKLPEDHKEKKDNNVVDMPRK